MNSEQMLYDIHACCFHVYLWFWSLCMQPLPFPPPAALKVGFLTPCYINNLVLFYENIIFFILNLYIYASVMGWGNLLQHKNRTVLHYTILINESL